MHKVLHRIFNIKENHNPLISILLSNRKSSLPLNDELLFHSSGPITDLSEYSFLPSLDTLRILFMEPENNNSSPKNISALDGDVLLQNSNPLHMIVQEMKNKKWATLKEYYPQDISEAMKIIENYEIKYDLENELPIAPGGFAGLLGYDMSRWTNPVFLNHIPKSGTLLGVLWRTEAWWILSLIHI